MWPLRSVALDQNAIFIPRGATPCKPPHRDTLDLPIESQYPKTTPCNPSVVVLSSCGGLVFSSFAAFWGGILPFWGVSCLPGGYPETTCVNPSVVVSSCGGLVFFLQPFAGTAFLGSFLPSQGVSCLPGGSLSAWRYLAFLRVSCFRGGIVFWWFLPSSRVSCLSGGVRRLWVVSCPFGVDFFPSGGVSYLTGGILAFWQVCGLSDYVCKCNECFISLCLGASRPSASHTRPSVSSPDVLPRSILLSLGARQPPGSKRESSRTSSSNMWSRGYLLRL